MTEEDNYKGFRIPKGSTIIAPLWGIHLNPKDVRATLLLYTRSSTVRCLTLS